MQALFSEEIKSLALAILELCSSESISQSVGPSVRLSVSEEATDRS